MVLTVNSAIAPQITSQPTNKTVTAGQAVTFTVLASGTAPLKYFWFRSGTGEVSSATNSTLSLVNVQPFQAGNYFVVVTNIAGTATSSLAVLTVIAAPTIQVPPANAYAHVGDNVAFSVIATGTGSLAYQWLFNGLQIAGANASSLSISNIQNVNFGVYSVRVSDSTGAVISQPAYLLFAEGGGGTVSFNNRRTNFFISRVYNVDTNNGSIARTGNAPGDYPPGTQVYTGVVQGSNFIAQLWSAKGADQAESVLLPATPITTFRTGVAAGNISPSTATLANVPPGLSSGHDAIARLGQPQWDHHRLGAGAFRSHRAPWCLRLLQPQQYRRKYTPSSRIVLTAKFQSLCHDQPRSDSRFPTIDLLGI